jgi:hypothetical protein
MLTHTLEKLGETELLRALALADDDSPEHKAIWAELRDRLYSDSDIEDELMRRRNQRYHERLEADAELKLAHGEIW